MKKILIALASVTAFSPNAIAAMPDVETYNFVTQKYNFLLRTSRDSCGYYTDPKFVVRGDRPELRRLIVLITQTPNSGSLCNGMFEFQWLDLNCKTNQVSYTTAIGSPANWKYDRYTDPEVTKKACALPVVEFGIPNRRPPAR